jgi:uncharacterized YccA/Bax inhibitor family protein
MNLSKTSNPIFSGNTFTQSFAGTTQGVMTMQGTINKSLILLLIVIVAASFTWNMTESGNAAASGFMIGGAIVGFIFAMITIFKKDWAHITAPLYAVGEGLFLGGVSVFADMALSKPVYNEFGEIVSTTSSGIVLNAVALTFAVFLIMFLLYRNRIIQPTRKFMMGVVAATGAVALLYIVNLIMGLFGASLSFLNSPTPLGIGISVVVVIIAALNLILDFKNIEDGVAQQAPKQMEWFAAFGLMVTLVWLYIEILRLLMLLANRD